MKNFKSVLIALLLSTTYLSASDIDGNIMGYTILILIPFILISILYIISQNKLIDALQTNNIQLRTNKIWTWTQLIPIWSLVAQIVAIVKMTEQYKVFLKEKNIRPNEVKEYKPLWGWLFMGFMIASMLIPFLGIMTLIFWIIYWINIYGARKSIQHLYPSSMEK
jgi:hypothetical protein